MRTALIATLLLHGCDPTCEPSEETFEVDDVLTSKEVTVMVEWWGLSSSSQLQCADVCQYVYEDRTGWIIAAVSDCTMSLSDTGGDIQCSGEGIEDSCQ